MLNPVLLTLIIIVGVYVLIQSVRVILYKYRINLDVCALCAAVSLTWITASVFNYLPPVITALLMGTSVLAIADKFRDYANYRHWEGLPYRAVSMALGLMVAMILFLLKRWI